MQDTRPEKLWNLFIRYDKTRFILLHAGFPWFNEAFLLTKYFNNVFLDLAWTHIISPDYTTGTLQSWIDIVPVNKILGFGGDHTVVEKIFGHLTIAKSNIAKALSNKVSDGDISLQDAYIWANAILCENPREIYKI